LTVGDVSSSQAADGLDDDINMYENMSDAHLKTAFEEPLEFLIHLKWKISVTGHAALRVKHRISCALFPR